MLQRAETSIRATVCVGRCTCIVHTYTANDRAPPSPPCAMLRSMQATTAAARSIEACPTHALDPSVFTNERPQHHCCTYACMRPATPDAAVTGCSKRAAQATISRLRHRAWCQVVIAWRSVTACKVTCKPDAPEHLSLHYGSSYHRPACCHQSKKQSCLQGC